MVSVTSYTGIGGSPGPGWYSAASFWKKAIEAASGRRVTDTTMGDVRIIRSLSWRRDSACVFVTWGARVAVQKVSWEALRT